MVIKQKNEMVMVDHEMVDCEMVDHEMVDWKKKKK